MQTVELDVERHLDPAQSHRLHVIERSPEASDTDRHAASLRRATSEAQLNGKSSSSLWTAWSSMRAGTSASQACGSTSLSFAVMISIGMIAARPTFGAGEQPGLAA